MATVVLTAPVITVNSVNLSALIDSVEINDETADVTNTSFGSAGNVTRQGGLRSGSITINFQQDYAASLTDATLWAARGTAIPIQVKATSAANSATNPRYDGTYLLTQYKPVAGKVGDLMVFSITWPRTGDLVRTVV